MLCLGVKKENEKKENEEKKKKEKVCFHSYYLDQKKRGVKIRGKK